NSEIQTPHLDRLAAEGMRFTNFFCTSPVCSPARASLLTGRMPSQHGVHDWIRGGNVPGAHGDESIEYLAGQLGYTAVLAANGDRCGLSGKWHLGDSYQPQQGFTHWYVHEQGGGPYYHAPMIRNGQPERDPRYLTDLITDDALAFIDRNAENSAPFYLGVHYTAPHSPWIENHPPELVALYDDCPFASCPQEPKHPWVKPDILADAWANPRENLQGYFAAVTAMDRNIGRILEKLDALDIRKDTLIFFTSDNGFNCGHHGIWGKGNGTFPQNMFDNSVKVPTLISHRGAIAEGVICDALLSGYDWLPTLLEYVGLDDVGLVHGGNEDRAVDLPGRSFVPLLRGEASTAHEQVVVYDEYGPVRMVRTAEWKYVHRYPYGPHELYDLVHDPEERTNLVAQEAHRGQVTALKARLEQWFSRYTDPLRDGRVEPVTGKGQLRLAGPAGRGEQAFA
ncbi:MAG: sulfatase-like hydrolase/transferase, partial [Caldilineaceae bacterium]|nr:sulfatase-like hydrolase/transferase [Caldilineaceae bacterium]